MIESGELQTWKPSPPRVIAAIWKLQSRPPASESDMEDRFPAWLIATAGVLVVFKGTHVGDSQGV
ncbi:unnamed protein product [Cuscuta europaea]|uniref:Uncharacterized protein n=1 Tax=Cuscuta europaea TaxID=41803 RepID=A0A9P0ZGV0_CUSEU|nr:unnamed protein product [Cuscuta europaea]